MVVQHPFDRVPGDVVAEIRERATDARVPPRWILDRHPHHEVGHLAWRERPASTSAGAAVVLPGKQPPVPAENRVRRDDAGDLRQHPPAEFLASHRESTALGVGQAKWTWATLLPEDPILLPERIDHVFLVAVHPASGREKEEAQRVGHSLRLLGEQPLAPTLFRRFANLGRFVAPYAHRRGSTLDVTPPRVHDKDGMKDSPSPAGRAVEQLARELSNFEEIARGIMPRPGSVPTMTGLEVYGKTLPLNGIVGGDHLIYVDFKKRYDLSTRIQVARDAGQPDIATNLERCRRMAGVALIDVSGHQATDAMLAAMFHQAFLVGILYELDMSGTVTNRLFENLNQRFHRTSQSNKFITAVYGEIAENATFRFLSAAHPPPVVFSATNDRFMEIDATRYMSFPPLGMLPSKSVVDWHRTKGVLGFKDRYEINEWTLMGSGDLLVLSTDGLQEHAREGEPYCPGHLEQTIRAAKHLSAADIVHTVLDAVRTFADPEDDVSLVVIKKH